ncbi:MAG: O-antigen ligase family protein [Acidimicrobiales bacterium]
MLPVDRRHPDELRSMVSWLASRPRPLLLAFVGLTAGFMVGALGVFNLRYGLVLIVAVAVVIVALLWPAVGGLILVGLVPAVSGFRPGFPIPNTRLSEALIGLICITLLVFTRRRDALRWGVLDWLLLAYGMAWALFGLVNAGGLGQHLTLSDWGTVFGQLQFFLLYRSLRLVLRTKAERRRALGVLFGASAVVALFAVVQQVNLPGVRPLLNSITGGTPRGTTNELLRRATGPFDNWAALAGYLLPVLVVVCALGLAGEARRQRKAFIALAACAAVGLALTADLSAIICFTAGVIALGVQYGHSRRMLRWLVIGLAVGAVVVGPFIAQRLSGEFAHTAGSSRNSFVPQTIGYRWEIWTTQYFPAIEARPFVGYGAILPDTVAWPYPESQYIAYLMEGGGLLLLIFGYLTWAMIRHARIAVRSPDPFDQAIGRSLVVLVVALVVMDAIWPFLSNGGMPQILWCLFALAVPGIPVYEARERWGIPERLAMGVPGGGEASQSQGCAGHRVP